MDKLTTPRNAKLKNLNKKESMVIKVEFASDAGYYGFAYGVSKLLSRYRLKVDVI